MLFYEIYDYLCQDKKSVQVLLNNKYNKKS
jgi:hypothetical protein